MKEFFNRKNVAVTITLVVIAIALVIGFTSAPKQAATSTTSQTAASASSDAAGWAKKNYGQYEDFLEDDADLFSDTTLETFAKYNAQLDYTYGSIMGLATTDGLDGKSMADYAIDESAEVIMNNCIRCHTQLNTEFVNTGRIDHEMAMAGEGKACWDCHREVPHGGTNSLSSTPNALVPYPKSVSPDWLKDMLSK